MNINPEQFPTYKSLSPVLRNQTTCLPQKKRDFLSNIREETDKKRRELYNEMERGKITPEEFADAVNKLHDAQLLRIADQIRRDDYIKLFGTPPEKPIHLADPKFASLFFKK